MNIWLHAASVEMPLRSTKFCGIISFVSISLPNLPMRKLLTSLLVAASTITPMFTIGNYIENTRTDTGTFCNRWDSGVYQAVYKVRFADFHGYEDANKRSGLRTRMAGFNAVVPTCETEPNTFGIQI